MIFYFEGIIPFCLVFTWILLRSDGICSIFFLKAVKNRMACPHCSEQQLSELQPRSIVADPLLELHQCTMTDATTSIMCNLSPATFLEYCLYSAEGTAIATWSVIEERTAKLRFD